MGTGQLAFYRILIEKQFFDCSRRAVRKSHKSEWSFFIEAAQMNNRGAIHGKEPTSGIHSRVTLILSASFSIDALV